MQLGRLGVWCSIEHLASPAAASLAQRIEGWGYGALWQPESVGRNALVASSFLLASTERLIVATGIANIYSRDASACRAAQLGLAEQSGGRFLLGLGVSHAPLVEGLRGHHYGKPLASMRTYLEAMSKALYFAPQSPEAPNTVLAALGPRMLELAAGLADGALTYNATPEHTADARCRLGPGKLLCVEQKVVMETDRRQALNIGRATLKQYLGLRNYQENWRRLGFSESDWAGEGSDRLIDALVAWGDEDAVRTRLQQHWDAGADHICIQPLSAEGPPIIDEALLTRFAPQ